MIRFAVILFFFFQLAILRFAPRFAWVGRLIGWGTCGFFLFLWLFQVEENSDYVFAVLAGLTGLSMGLAELAARPFKKDKN